MLILCDLSSHQTILQMMKLRLLNLLKVTKFPIGSSEVVQDCLTPKNQT